MSARKIQINAQQIAKDAQKWLLEHLKEDHSLYNADDVAAYHKLPYVFSVGGYKNEACSLLKLMRDKFADQYGNFFTDTENKIKSNDDFFEHFQCLINAWIAVGSHCLGQFDVSFTLYAILRKFYHPEAGGFITSNPYGEGDNFIDAITTTELGLVCLYFGDLNKAKRAGNFLIRCLSIQPDIKNGYYLQMDDSGKLNTVIPEDNTSFFYMPTKDQNKTYFNIGRSMYFLAKLYLATNESSFLTAAKAYSGFCKNYNLEDSKPSPVIMLGFALLARLTNETAYIRQRDEIAENMLSTWDGLVKDLTNLPAVEYYNLMADCAVYFQEFASEVAISGK